MIFRQTRCIVVLMKKKDEAHELNKKEISLEEFLKIYNESIPKAFCKATVPILEKFQRLNSSLFKNKDLWSIDQHRKKLIDWFFSDNHKS